MFTSHFKDIQDEKVEKQIKSVSIATGLFLVGLAGAVAVLVLFWFTATTLSL